MADYTPMNESTLLIALIAALDAGIAAYSSATGPGGVALPALPAGLISQRAFQPRQEGAPSAPAIIVNHARNKPRGFPKRKSFWNQAESVMYFEHWQRMESTYHVEALIPQSPATPDAMTEADVLNIARFILQNDATLQTLGTQGVYLLRIDAMDSNYIEDDADQNENVPYFEITFVYRWSIVTTTPTVFQFVETFGRV